MSNLYYYYHHHIFGNTIDLIQFKVNGGRRVDNYFEDFFMKMDRDGILNHTAVLFISDHGFRFGSFRATALGRYEDMLPYGFVLMPEWFYEENPDALVNLKVRATMIYIHMESYLLANCFAEIWKMQRFVLLSLIINRSFATTKEN